MDLHWLVQEGYVTEFADGRLITPPPMPLPAGVMTPIAAELAAPGTEPASSATSAPEPAASGAEPASSATSAPKPAAPGEEKNSE